MDPQQQADLAAALAETGHPNATPEGTQDVQNAAQKAPESADNGHDSAQKVSQSDTSVQNQSTEAQEQVANVSKHQQVLQRMMEKARLERESQAQEQQTRALQEQAQYAQRLMEARQYGPDALLKAAGVEAPAKPAQPSLADLFADTEEKPQTPAELLELQDKMSKMDDYIKKLEQERSQEKEQTEQQQMQYHIQQEMTQLEGYLDENKDKYSFVDASRTMGSVKDLYNGRVSMYNQGYNPSNEDMLELVEARMEELIRLTAPTKKGRALIEELFGVNLPAQSTDSTTLSETAGGDTPARIAEGQILSDEENRQLALKEAYAARERLIKQMGK